MAAPWASSSDNGCNLANAGCNSPMLLVDQSCSFSFSLSLSLHVWSSVQKWFEVKIWTEMILRVFWVIFRSKRKSISVDWIYWFNKTLKFYGKVFPKVIWSQNKHSHNWINSTLHINPSHFEKEKIQGQANHLDIKHCIMADRIILFSQLSNYCSFLLYWAQRSSLSTNNWWS